jgi:hypothetical protein
MQKLLPTTAVLLLSAATVLAQTQAPSQAPQRVRPGQPVDQTVGDLGPNSVSFRQVEPGLGEFSRATSLYRRFDPAGWQKRDRSGGLHLPQAYKYRAPGVEAYIDQPQYFTPRGRNVPVQEGPEDDPRFRQIITPNTVFDLIPDDHPAKPRPQPQAEAQTSRPLNGIGADHRLGRWTGGQVHGRIHGRIDGQVRGSGGSSSMPQQKRARQIAQALQQRQAADPPRSAPRTGQSLPERFGPNHPSRHRPAASPKQRPSQDAIPKARRVEPSRQQQRAIDRALQVNP